MTSRVKARALEIGFSSVGITDLSPVGHGDALDRWLDAGMAGDMHYMGRQRARRKEPALIRPEASRAVIVTVNYFRKDAPPPHAAGTGHVAKYARGTDYHLTVGRALQELADFVAGLGAGVAYPYVDAGPVPERELAQRAGLGWIGKNTMLIDPGRGSFTFLGSVLTDLELELDEPFEFDRCGTCTRCLEACPTGAFPEPRVLDSRRCISYLTIEHKGAIDSSLRGSLGDWIFGCDICQDVCPWNIRFADLAGEEILELDQSMERLELELFDELDEEAFGRRFGHTPLERPGLVGMRRNARLVREEPD